MSFLTIIQNATSRLGFSVPTTAYTSTAAQTAQLVALAQEEGIALMKRHPWPVLTKEKTFTGTAAAAQTNAIPSDFDRFVDETFFNRTKKRPVFGPISAQDWQFTQAVVATTFTESFRVRGSSILITPTPTTDTYAYEYISKNFCQSSGATEQALWAADTDTGILSEELMTQGVIWRFKHASGLDYGEDFQKYELHVANEFARQGGKRRLNMGQGVAVGAARKPFVQEGGWAL